MKYEHKFYRCSRCGNLVYFMESSGVPVICCGKPMAELIPNTVDAAQEKHVPAAASKEGGKIDVQVGSVPHPMTDEHHIAWIAVAKKDRTICANLKSGEAPEAKFCASDEPVTVYAYCNLHGLWSADL